MSLQAEAAVLSALMYRTDQIDDVRDIVRAEDFTERNYQNIYAAILSLHDQHKFIDLLTVANEVGNIACLTEIAANTQFGDVIEYAKIVAGKAKIRAFTQAWQQCNQIISDDSLDLAVRADTVADILAAAVQDEHTEAKTLTGKPLFTEWYNELERLANIGDEITGIKSGFIDFDKRTKGFHGGEMIVIAARPGMGKTNFAINVAWAAVRQQKRVLYFSLEMSTNELMHRFAAQAESIPYDRVQSADLENYGHKITNFASAALNLPLHINDRSGHTMASIRTEAKKLKRKHGLDMIVIDHIGLLNSKDKDQYSKMTNISRQVKLLAKELELPVIALTQLNRDVETRPDPRPMLRDLRDSGAIEQDADIVAFPYRINDKDATDDEKRIGALIIEKLRHGETGTIPLLVQFEYCRFLSGDQETLGQYWYKPKVKQERKL